MVQGATLTESERAVVLPHHKEGKSSRNIADSINRGRDAVMRIIRSGQIRGGQRRRSVK